MRKLIALLAAGALSLGFGMGIANASHTDGAGGPDACEPGTPGAPEGDPQAHGEICLDVDGEGGTDVYVGGNGETGCGEIWVAGQNVANSNDDDPTTPPSVGDGEQDANECT